jgi:hypothetical protein
MNTSPANSWREVISRFVQSPHRDLTLARFGWILLAAALLTMVGYSIGMHSTWISPSLPAAELEALKQIGVPPATYDTLRALLELTVLLAFTATSAVIFWSKRNDWMALLVSTALITFGGTVFPFITDPSLQWAMHLIQVIGIATAGLTIFLFPNGRFVPRWTRPLAFGLGIWLTALLVFPEVTSAVGSIDWLNPVQYAIRLIAWLLGTDVSAEAFDQAVQAVRTVGFVSMLVGVFGAGAFAQIYRYMNTSDPVEKQQTKLVVFGLAVAVVSSLFYYLPPVFLAPLREPGSAHWIFATVGQLVFSIALILVPVFLVTAMLRYRLWEVDLLINRTIVYTLLTGLLAAVYFASVYFFQSLVHAVTGQGSDLVLVVSTLMIAALFRPLRDRVQIFIDRRFFREKVDFRRAFTEFGSELRTLIDLPELERTLVGRVTDLLHVRYAAVFLRDAGGRFDPAYSQGIPPAGEASLPVTPEERQRMENGGMVYQPTTLPFPLLVPLIAPETERSVLVGVLALGPRLSSEQYTREDQSLLLGLAGRAGTSIRVAQLIDEKQTETRQRLDAEKQLADHWNSPLGRAEATADQLRLHPDRVLLELHRLIQAAREDPDSAALVANLPNALESSKAGELARLAEGFNYLLGGQISPEMLPVGLRTISASLDRLSDSTHPPIGATAARTMYSACLAALAARSVSDIAGWALSSGVTETAQVRVEFLSGLRGILVELGDIARSLQAFERVDSIQDKLAYLAGAVERLERLRHSTRNELGSADRPILSAIAGHWTAVAESAMAELRSRAQIVCELLTRHVWQEDPLTVVLSLRNAGRSPAAQLEVRLLPSAEYELAGNAIGADHLGPGEETRIEVPVHPRLPRGVRNMRVLFEIRYVDPRGPDQGESYADAVQLLEPAAAFQHIPNPYVVGTPLKAGSPMFFGRKDVMDFILEHLTAAHRNNLVLIGQRRTGKSSLLKQLPLVLGKDFLPVYLDGQSLALDPGLPAFLHAVAVEISLALEERGWKVPPPDLAQFSDHPTAIFEKGFLASVRRTIGSRHLLLLLDEFEELESAARRETLNASIFPFLRHLIQHSENLSVIFCGTHRLEELASDYWSVLFNISLYRHIGFLTREEAVRLIQEPVAAGGMRYDDLALDKIWRVTTGHPYFLQLICHSLVNRHNRMRRSYVSVGDVNASVEEILATGEAHFVYLWMESTAEQKLALYAMSHLGGAGFLTPAQAADELGRSGVSVQQAALEKAFRDLSARDIFSVLHRPDQPLGVAYGWKLGLLGLWVEKCRSLGQIIAEQ